MKGSEVFPYGISSCSSSEACLSSGGLFGASRSRSLRGHVVESKMLNVMNFPPFGFRFRHQPICTRQTLTPNRVSSQPFRPRTPPARFGVAIQYRLCHVPEIFCAFIAGFF